jgi:hypothetical protein
VSFAGVEQDALGGRGFTRVNMGNNADISNDLVDKHGPFNQSIQEQICMLKTC